jgi:hypothetical protein
MKIRGNITLNREESRGNSTQNPIYTIQPNFKSEGRKSVEHDVRSMFKKIVEEKGESYTLYYEPNPQEHQ